MLERQKELQEGYSEEELVEVDTLEEEIPKKAEITVCHHVSLKDPSQPRTFTKASS